MRTFVKLLALFAVLLMPLGMAAPASASQHHSMASMPMQHCPEQSPSQKGKLGFSECTMACAGALPAIEASREGESVVDPILHLPLSVLRLHGLHPEIATPPPKQA